MEAEVLIIGAGVAGLSTAYHLARSGQENVCVLEQEKELGGHASGRNAGMIRQAIQDPVLAQLAHEGREALSRLKEKEWQGLGFRSIGSLLLAGGKEVEELRETESSLKKLGLESRRLTAAQAARMATVLEGADFEEALFCPSDAVLEIRALLEGFLRQLKRFRISVLFGHRLHEIQPAKDGFRVTAGSRKLYAKKIVNASGAWGALVAKKAGAAELPMTAYRRHLYLSRPFPPVTESWPFIWDLSHSFYFRPAGEGGLLMSPCDKDAVRVDSGREEKKAERTDPRMSKILESKLREFSKAFASIKIKSTLAGLRTMAPDGRFVIGEDTKRRGFYWVAGLGGHGVTTCFSVGKLASDIILGMKMDNGLQKALSPRRFSSV